MSWWFAQFQYISELREGSCSKIHTGRMGRGAGNWQHHHSSRAQWYNHHQHSRNPNLRRILSAWNQLAGNSWTCISSTGSGKCMLYRCVIERRCVILGMGATVWFGSAIVATFYSAIICKCQCIFAITKSHVSESNG